jgi:hypothetical protein
MPTKAEKAKTTRQINKMFEYEMKNGYFWNWGDRLDLRNAVDVPPEQVKIVLSRVVSKLPKLEAASKIE